MSVNVIQKGSRVRHLRIENLKMSALHKFIPVLAVIALLQSVDAGSDRTVRSTIAGTGWTPYEYFPHQFKDDSQSWNPRAEDESTVVDASDSDADKGQSADVRGSPALQRVIDRNGYQHKKHNSIRDYVVYVPVKYETEHKPYLHYFKNRYTSYVIDSPICPQNTYKSRPIYAFSNKYGRCYKIGSKGPCRPNMRFFLESPNSEYGRCDCDPNIGAACGRPLVYVDGWCYPVNSRGPCSSTEWLTLTKHGNPTCQPNRCLWEQRFDKTRETDCQHWVYMHGQCFETSTQAFCGRNEALFWDVYDSTATKPVCVSKWSPLNPTRTWNQELDYSQFDETLPCFPGQRQTILHKCRPN